MSTLTIEVPDEVAQALRLPAQEMESRLLLELATALYAQRILGLGKAAELARLPVLRFDEELVRRQIPAHFDESDLAQDVTYGLGRE